MWLPTLITLLVTNSIPEETAASLREALPQAQIAQADNRITVQGTSDETIRAKTLFYQLDRPLDQILFKAKITNSDQDQDLQPLASCRDGRTVSADLNQLHLVLQPKLQDDGHNIQVHLRVENLEMDVTLGDGRTIAIQGPDQKNTRLLLSAEIL